MIDPVSRFFYGRIIRDMVIEFDVIRRVSLKVLFELPGRRMFPPAAERALQL